MKYKKELYKFVIMNLKRKKLNYKNHFKLIKKIIFWNPENLLKARNKEINYEIKK
ncbi:hypothetical protein [Metamycoplasma gateae]|uniref:Uncharacterized protein n=1 Tax=Metamycoplasma gateae TaxID=35769 RepID=A0ABZ2AJU8_9BACT|nr:hypothetical protein V2E26_02575 [Metamycoplasma gateae]